jgi:hypothetical protein
MVRENVQTPDAKMGLSYHGVLAHQDNTLAAKGLTNLVHLLRRDIVDRDDEDGPVLLQQALQLVEVAGLVSRFAPHIFLVMKAGCLRAMVLWCGNEELRVGDVVEVKKFPAAELPFSHNNCCSCGGLLCLGLRGSANGGRR